MIDREKVIKGIDICLHRFRCGEDCPYRRIGCMGRLKEDAIALLKEHDNCENCAIAIEDRQPVIRCKECKYWRQLYGDRSSTGCCDCDDMWRSLDGEITEVDDIKTDSDFYCGYAERR